MNRPISSGSFDPLAPPGSGSQIGLSNYGPDLSPGTFVTANIPNTAFYKNKPKGNEDADKLLDQGTNMKIVSADTNHVKVELDSGEVGWVPSVMVASPNTAAQTYPVDGTYQIYPPFPVMARSNHFPSSMPMACRPKAPSPPSSIPMPRLTPRLGNPSRSTPSPNSSQANRK